MGSYFYISYFRLIYVLTPVYRARSGLTPRFNHIVNNVHILLLFLRDITEQYQVMVGSALQFTPL